jgi:hypothetical protein
VKLLIAATIAIGLFMLVKFFRGPAKAGAPKRTLTATIAISPSGESQVSFTPEVADPELLVKLLVCYGAKLRWLLNNEPPIVVEALRGFSAEAIDQWAALNVSNLIEAMPSASLFAANADGAAVAVGQGEQFVVRLQVLPDGAGYVTNKIPKPGMSINLAWHFVLLLKAVRDKLSAEERRSSIYVLQGWFDSVFSELGENKSMAGAKALNKAANEAYVRAQRLANRVV